MREQDTNSTVSTLDALFQEADTWHVNTGGETIHAKRMSGRWRSIKWLSSSIYLFFFFGPYLRWGERQAVLFDIPERQFHLFGATVLPQDFWMLALLMLFFAILLLVLTVMSGRVWCGFFCFQTVWTDIYTLIEEKLEGAPQQRRRLATAPMSMQKIGAKAAKHTLWLVIAVLTGIAFCAWFTDGYALWVDVFALDLNTAAWTTIILFTAGTYLLAGFMREQTCMWLCPYARIQGAMVEPNTVLPTYDFTRGEPRSRLRKSGGDDAPKAGDCIDCNQCVAVCPTGVDIRNGQQEGCIMCALCLDACDAVMDKVGRPHGLIRWESLDGLEGRETRPLLKRPRVWILNGILLASLLGIGYGLSTIDALELKVLHERQPLFVLQSDGSIQNRYTLKLLNKLPKDTQIKISATGPEGLVLVGVDELVSARQGNVTAAIVFARVPRDIMTTESVPIVFKIETEAEGQLFSSQRESVFIGPKR
ncbi:cytochrome c oxidase accessory protein CcoG [Pseudomonadota bacterium]